MRALLIAALASFAGAALLPASAGAQESACSVYCEQVPSGGGGANSGDNAGSPNGADTEGSGSPSSFAPGANSTVDEVTAGGSNMQGVADDTSRDGALSGGERGQGGDSTGQVEDDAESITALGGNSGGDSGIGIGLPVLLALVLLGAIGFAVVNRSDPVSP